MPTPEPTPDQAPIIAHVREHGRVTLMEAFNLFPASVRSSTAYLLYRMVQDGLLARERGSQHGNRSWCLPGSPDAAPSTPTSEDPTQALI